MRLKESFYRRKLSQIQEELGRRNLDGLFIHQHLNIFYTIGFFHTPTERPICLFIPVAGEPVVFVPKLEEDYVREAGLVPEVEVYFEYPGVVHPIDFMMQRLAARGYGRGRIGFEGAMSVTTRERVGRALPGATWVEAGDIIASLRLVKDPEEIALHRKAAEYADRMVEAGVAFVRERGRAGRFPSENEIAQYVTDWAITRMEEELEEVVVVSMLAGGLVYAGPRSAFPHGLPSRRRVQLGDNLILSLGCAVGAYFAECERTFFIGEPTSEQRRYYEICREAQETGTMALTPGARCCDANRICLDVIRRHGLGDYIKHRQGHGIGITFHEPPWIEDGDTTVLRPGMVVSSEPGIYVPGHGGYRISDTVLVGEQGPERLTRFPRDLQSVIIDL